MNGNNNMDKTIQKPYEKDSVKYLTNFLNNHKTKGEYTHTAYGGKIWGRFDIPDNELSEFYNIYKRAIEKSTFNFTEKQKEIGPFIIDLDFKFDKKNNKRYYTNDDILLLVKKTIEKIKRYYKIHSRDIKIIISEKESPCYKEKSSEYKDGFHIIVPIPMDVKMRYFLLDELKNDAIKEDWFEHIPHNNSINDIFDSAIVINNGWMLYGSQKPDGKMYNITNIYDGNCKQLNLNNFDRGEYVILCSVRQFEYEDKLIFKDKYATSEFTDKVNKVTSQYFTKKSQKIIEMKEMKETLETTKTTPQLDKIKTQIIGKLISESDIEIAKKIVDILANHRSEIYSEWISVGWALYNTSPSLLPEFIKFSKKCKNKYQEGCCERVWEKSRNDESCLGISTLHWWAKLDNEKEYKEIMGQTINKYVLENDFGHHDDIAKVVFEIYKHNYKCVSIKKNMWYEFQGHRWVAIEEGYTLNNKLSDEVAVEYGKMICEHSVHMFDNISKPEEYEKIQKKIHSISKLLNNMKNEGFKNSVMGACSKRFYDSKFISKLDDNPNIIGFNNGVYDLKNRCFREGTPDDYVTFTCGYDFTVYDDESPEIIGLNKFFGQVHQDEDIRLYVLKLIASHIDGNIEDQKFVLWTGSGSNGKSRTVDLMRYALGDYFDVLPITVLTRKRGSSSNATPELANKVGKRSLAIQEPEHNDVIYVGFMKQLTGGDWIDARPLYGNTFTYKPQFKIFLTCNKMPKIPSTDGGTLRRLSVTPWKTEFVDGTPVKSNQFKKDPTLCNKLKDWNKAFMYLLCTKYYPMYKDEGLKEPKEVTQYTDKYKKDNDLYYEFFSEHLTITKNNKDFESFASIFSTFKNWFRDYYSNNNPSKKELENYFDVIGLERKGENVYGVKFIMGNEFANV